MSSDDGLRLLMAGTGLVFLFGLVEGLRTGVMGGEFVDYDINERPIRYALALAGSVLAILVCGIIAAGYRLEDVWQAATGAFVAISGTDGTA